MDLTDRLRALADVLPALEVPDARARDNRSRRVWNGTSAPDAIVEVGDTDIALENPGALELDVLGTEALEETPPLTEEHRDQVDLDLVWISISSRTPAASASCAALPPRLKADEFRTRFPSTFHRRMEA
jgi:hypothetical protein